ncbi:MAG: VCBS repeat-containing protein [Chitinophagaceae bacterium]
MKYLLLCLWCALVLMIFSCKNETKKEEPLFEKMEHTGIDFNNVVTDGRLENSFLFRNFYNGGGVALGDINNDGLPDVFLTSNMGANKLYLNKGNFQFEDISQKAGILPDDKWNTGVVFTDVNSDGWLDIYVCTSGHMGTGTRRNKLYINNHNQTFTESAAKYGLDISAYTTQVSFFDYDMDGDLDCFMINNCPIPINQLNYANRRDMADSTWPIAGFLKGGGDHLYRNDLSPDGQPHFTEVTQQAGIHGGLISFGLGVSVGDINNDGYPDVFVSNDSYERDYLYINQKNGTFKDELEDWMQHTSFSSMGADIADINNDGYSDLFTTDMLALNDFRLKTTGSFDNISLFNSKVKSGFYYQYTKNCLQLNNKNGKFVDIARYAGMAATDWSWGALMFDMDNDGWNDVLVCNGVNRDVTNLDFMDFFANDVIQKMVMTGKKDEIDKVLKEIPQTPLPNKVYKNDKNLSFTDIGDQWGLSEPTFSNGAAYADLDNDGDLDLIINNENQQASIYKNRSRELNKNNYLGVVLKSPGKNPFAVGTKVQLFVGDEIMTREEVPSRGFQSSVDYKLIFGLGKQNTVDSIVVTWPDRTITHVLSPAINQVHIFEKTGNEKLPAPVISVNTAATYFTKVESSFDRHAEDDYIDFYTERGVPRMLSREGPGTAYADVNGDGLTDIYIGGTAGHPGQLYLQSANGKFTSKDEKAFPAFSDFEDVTSLFFDCDHDNDMDLLVCPGGNNHPAQSRELQLRLFKNDGKGNFTIDADAFPSVGMDISTVAANDFNHDGFTDLFIGGRNFPGEYGKDPRSYIFVNDGNGHFKDIALENSAIANIGMVTAAVWADVVGDANKELIIAGEWMTPRIFSFNKDHFEEVKTNMNNLFGWWQTINTADVNGDGREDLILGNIGENFYLRPDSSHPVKLWINDYDNNNSINKIISYTIDGKDMPVSLKHDLEEQLPVIKKSNLKHAQYAKQSVEELFPKELLNASTVKLFNYASSCVAINEGNGKFSIQKLPVSSQLSCINVIRTADVNNDGYPDLITGGNQFGFLPQFEKLDGCFGDVLINDGKGGFKSTESKKTGLMLRGELRDIGQFTDKKNNYFLFIQNDEVPVLYRLNNKDSKSK